MGAAIITQERFDERLDKLIATAVKTGKEQSLSDDFGRGRGSFKVRVTKAGHVWFYFRYSDGQGQQKQIPIHVGGSDAAEHGKEGWAKAWSTAELWSGYLRDGHRDDLAAFIACQEAKAKVQAETARAIKEAEEAKTKAGSLRALCNEYTADLEKKKKYCEKEVKNTFRLNVFAYPDIADKPARQVTKADIRQLLDKKPRNAARKLRSYLAAAYNLALEEQNEFEEEKDDSKKPLLAKFALEINPAALIDSKKYKGDPGTRDLNISELKVFLAKLKAVKSLAADGVRLCLFAAGQRPTQLLRVKPSDYDADERTLTLRDPKGRRRSAREHIVPLNALALPLVRQLMKDNDRKEYLFTLREVPLREERLSEVVRAISKEMVAEGTARGAFTLGDLRRSAETQLSKLGIDKQTRAHVLSHGIGGLQDTVYDKNDYLAEKREAIDKWATKLMSLMDAEPEQEPAAEEVLPANVLPLRRRG